MAANGAVWGIDIGACALKALRCRRGDNATQIVAEAFDYVEYPTILGQPDADDATLIRDALKTFLSRNTLRGDQVAISVSGQNGLARFIKLPPVEAKKIPRSSATKHDSKFRSSLKKSSGTINSFRAAARPRVSRSRPKSACSR